MNKDTDAHAWALGVMGGLEPHIPELSQVSLHRQHDTPCLCICYSAIQAARSVRQVASVPVAIAYTNDVV